MLNQNHSDVAWLKKVCEFSNWERKHFAFGEHFKVKHKIFFFKGFQ